MQYLRQGTTALVPVDAGLPLYKNGVAAGSIGSDGLTAVDTDTCGRLDVGSREFMVLAQPVYDALVTGASLLPADAQRIANSPAQRLADLYNVGYDSETHEFTSLSGLKAIERLDKAYEALQKGVRETLQRITDAVARLDRPDRIIKADVLSADGVPIKRLFDELAGQLSDLAKPKTVDANVVMYGGSKVPLGVLLDLLANCYKPDTHSILKVERVGRTGEVETPVDANLIGVLGDVKPIVNFKAAFDGVTGYAFKGSSMPEVVIVKSKVNANVESIKDKDAQNLAECFAGKGFPFTGSSMPRVEVVGKVPDVTMAGDPFNTLREAIGTVGKQLKALVDGEPLSVDVKTIAGNAAVVALLLKLASGEGCDLSNVTVSSKASDLEARRAIRAAALKMSKED